jgi:NADPH-dependent 2,4-dienoyl-CoA reductase/sulfur reductase-like enzyme
MQIDRRAFLTGAATATGALALAAPAALGQAQPKVVVVGGGPGGATAARHIAADAKGAIDVTLVEPAQRFVTCFHSNLYLGGLHTFDEITHGYDRLAAIPGLKLVHQWATAIDRDKREVRLADGSTLAYDRLVLSPGIDLKYDSVPGWGKAHEETMPHAWKAGPQTRLLKARLDAVPDGGVIVVIAPPNPYRCPPGPYERVSMMAHVLKTAGKSKARIVVIDPKPTFSKQGLFQEGWEQHYPGMVEWLAPDIHEGLRSVDPATNSVVTGFETYSNCALVNVIPAQTAGRIALDAGLADGTGYCPIRAESMQAAGDANIYILGDTAIAGDMPKSAFSANSQAKVVAMTVRGELTQARTFPARYANTCWSLIATDDAVKVGGRYEPKDGRIAAIETFISQPGETPELRRQTQVENMGWYSGIVADIFG